MDALNDKYKEIVKKGKKLFWKYGIKKVTVEEICNEAGTSRVTFYKYFTNKEDLLYNILKELTDESLKEYREIMESDTVFEQKVKQTILLKIKNTDRISHELLNDVYSGDFPKIKNYMQKVSKESFSMIEDDYRKAQEKGYIRNDLKIEFIMYMLNRMQEIVSNPHLESLYHDSGELISELINYFFYGILPRNH